MHITNHPKYEIATKIDPIDKGTPHPEVQYSQLSKIIKDAFKDTLAKQKKNEKTNSTARSIKRNSGI